MKFVRQNYDRKLGCNARLSKVLRSGTTAVHLKSMSRSINMSYTTLSYEVSEHILTLTLNRPDQLNSFTVTMANETPLVEPAKMMQFAPLLSQARVVHFVRAWI
jgi:hypothetical protein